MVRTELNDHHPCGEMWNVTDNPVVRILWAAETGNVDIVKEMLNKDAELISATDADGYTPLHRASYEGHCQVVQVCTIISITNLLKAGMWSRSRDRLEMY